MLGARKGEEESWHICDQEIHGVYTCKGLFTLVVVLTVAPALRSFLTTLEWPLEDATVSAVSPSCDKVEGCFIMQCISLCNAYRATSCTEVITKQQLVRISDPNWYIKW